MFGPPCPGNLLVNLVKLRVNLLRQGLRLPQRHRQARRDLPLRLSDRQPRQRSHPHRRNNVRQQQRQPRVLRKVRSQRSVPAFRQDSVRRSQRVNDRHCDLASRSRAARELRKPFVRLHRRPLRANGRQVRVNGQAVHHARDFRHDRARRVQVRLRWASGREDHVPAVHGQEGRVA